MNIVNLVHEKFQHNQSLFRSLCDNNVLGILACGFVLKNKKQGSHIDFEINHYGGVMVLSGTGEYSDDILGKIPIKAGDFIQRFPGCKHTTLVTSDDWSEMYIAIGTVLFESLKAVSVISIDRPILATGLDFTLIEQLLEFYNKLEVANNLELSLLVSEAIAIISRANFLDKQNAHSSDEINMLTMSCNYIESNIFKRFSVKDVADHMNIGYEKFRKIFTNHFGVGPGLYMIQQRIHMAQKMLADNNLSIKEIALELGYSDAYAFSKQFKNLMGISPSEFKKRYIF